ncbi:lipase secretion chaperone [Frateuria aurantia]
MRSHQAWGVVVAVVLAWMAWAAQPGKVATAAGAVAVDATTTSASKTRGPGEWSEPGRWPRWDDSRLRQHSSLRASQPDGAFTLDSAGRLRPDRALRDRFDYYLALIGEASLGDIRHLLSLDMQAQQLGPGAATEVAQLFEAYLRLQQVSAALSGQRGPLLQRLLERRRMRQDILGEPVAQAFYGEDQVSEDQQLAQLKIALDPVLSEAEKRTRLEALQQQALKSDPVWRQEMTAVRLEQMTAMLDRSAAEPAERHRQRARIWGPEAADRLAALDLERLHWQQRVERYQQQRAALLRDAAMSAEQQQAALQALGDKGFSPREQQRLRAWLSADAGQPGD